MALWMGNRGKKETEEFPVDSSFRLGHAHIRGWYDCGTFWIYMSLLGLLTQTKTHRCTEVVVDTLTHGRLLCAV